MMDQAADIAFFAIMAAVAPLLLTITACLNAPLASHRNNNNFTAAVYPFISLMCPLTRTLLSSKSPGYTACIISMAAGSAPAPIHCSYPQRNQQNHFHAKGGKTNGERKH